MQSKRGEKYFIQTIQFQFFRYFLTILNIFSNIICLTLFTEHVLVDMDGSILCKTIENTYIMLFKYIIELDTHLCFPAH